jgi:hypothetical protein
MHQIKDLIISLLAAGSLLFCLWFLIAAFFIVFG